MKKEYIRPEIEVAKIQVHCILAGSQFLDDADTQNLELEDEVLDGSSLWVY